VINAVEFSAAAREMLFEIHQRVRRIASRAARLPLIAARCTVLARWHVSCLRDSASGCGSAQLINQVEISMKTIVAISLVALSTTAWAQATVAQQQAKQATSQAHILTRAEFDTLLAAPDKVVVIDVRRPDELTSIGGFPAYFSIQLADLEKYAAFIPKERTVVTVSNHAGRAGKAADLLASKGFKVAGAIGAQNYAEQGGKLTKIEPKKPAATAANTKS
jgi:rhodanese-related sulfurtransferase